MSISFEKLQDGQRWQSTGRTLTDADLTIACITSGDGHLIHVAEDKGWRHTVVDHGVKCRAHLLGRS